MGTICTLRADGAHHHLEAVFELVNYLPNFVLEFGHENLFAMMVGYKSSLSLS